MTWKECLLDYGYLRSFDRFTLSKGVPKSNCIVPHGFSKTRWSCPFYILFSFLREDKLSLKEEDIQIFSISSLLGQIEFHV